MINTEDEKKAISEYASLVTQAKKQRKSKNFKIALISYQKCLDIVSKIKNDEKICESNFYVAQCQYTLNNITQCKEHYASCDKLIDSLNRESFPYFKIKGKLIAKMIHVFLALNHFNECEMYFNQKISNIASEFTIDQKLNFFLPFIKELLYPMKKGKRLMSFISDYQSMKNDILYNNEKFINPKMKNVFHNLMNSTTKQLLFDKNNILFYNTKYKISSNHAVLNFIEKNIEMLEDNSIPIQKIKMTFDLFLKNKKVKVDADFKVANSSEIIQEIKNRVDSFKKIYFLLGTSFSQIFKAHFDTSKLSLQIQSSGNLSMKYIKECPKTTTHNGNRDKPITPNNVKKERYPAKRLSLFEPEIQTNNLQNKINKENAPQSSIFCSKSPEIKRHYKKGYNINDEIIFGFETNPNEDNYYHYYNNNYPASPSHECIQYSSNDGNKLDNFDSSYATNISKLSRVNQKNCRNFNLFLLSTLNDEYIKKKQIRECDLIKLKIPNHVSSFGAQTLMGKHKKYGDSKDVNQDVSFIYNNYLLIQDVLLFGVCDGHGPKGHIIASHAAKSIPVHLHYIEIDNNLLKRNKSVNNIITSLYSLNERSNVKETNIIKYFYDKFSMNFNDVSIIKNSFTEVTDGIKEAFLNAQDDINKIKNENKNDIDNSGTTVCMAFIIGKKLLVANLGDSRGILCSHQDNGKWKTIQLSKDHKPYDTGEKNRIEKSGGKVHRCRNEEGNKEIGPYRVWFKNDVNGPGLAMSRSFGDLLAKKIGVICEPDIYEYTLSKEDKFIVIASDGIWEYMNNDDVMNIIISVYEKGGDGITASVELCRAAEEKWNQNGSKTRDDITCIVVFLNVYDN